MLLKRNGKIVEDEFHREFEAVRVMWCGEDKKGDRLYTVILKVVM